MLKCEPDKLRRKHKLKLCRSGDGRNRSVPFSSVASSIRFGRFYHEFQSVNRQRQKRKRKRKVKPIKKFFSSPSVKIPLNLSRVEFLEKLSHVVKNALFLF